MTVLRLAPPLDSYPELQSPFREDEVLPVIAVCPCACGAWVRQHEGEMLGIAVARHNRTSEHRAWRFLTDMENR